MSDEQRDAAASARSASTRSSATAAIAMAAAMCGAGRRRWPAPAPPAASGESRPRNNGKAQVLEQADRDRQPAVRAGVLRLLGELGDDDGGGGHRDGAADDHRRGRGYPSSTTTGGATTAVVTSTCAPPTPSTSPRMASKRGRENSRPSVNTRNTTPNPRAAASCRCRRPARSACGPSSMPTAR